ncbi:MAG: PAS domain-containing protein [Acidobacteria bacterium]|nr:PAS domain-containing protein [Acidobacteriota bacterium]
MPEEEGPSRKAEPQGASGTSDSDRFHELLDHLPVGVYRTTVDGRILECNQALAGILGFPDPAACRFQNVQQFYIRQEDRVTHLEQLSALGTVFTEFQFLTHDHRVIWVRDYPRAVLNPGGQVQYFDGIIVDVSELKRSEAERESLILELKRALENIRVLSELLPICSSCKKVRDDHGYWEAVEGYLLKHANIKFSHGLCPACARALYPDFAGNLQLPPESPD